MEYIHRKPEAVHHMASQYYFIRQFAKIDTPQSVAPPPIEPCASQEGIIAETQTCYV